MSLLAKLTGLMPLARYQVEGASMLPEVAAGERVVVNKAAYWLGKPSTGDLVVVRDPRDRQRLLIKRLDGPADGGRWNVLGANANASTDSRTFGPVARELLVGKVLLRY